MFFPFTFKVPIPVRVYPLSYMASCPLHFSCTTLMLLPINSFASICPAQCPLFSIIYSPALYFISSVLCFCTSGLTPLAGFLVWLSSIFSVYLSLQNLVILLKNLKRKQPKYLSGCVAAMPKFSSGPASFNVSHINCRASTHYLIFSWCALENYPLGLLGHIKVYVSWMKH